MSAKIEPKNQTARNRPTPSTSSSIADETTSKSSSNRAEYVSNVIAADAEALIHGYKGRTFAQAPDAVAIIVARTVACAISCGDTEAAADS
ncbi:hypothetical protein ACGE24_03015 [Corynebacterium kroppenstedtii]|uniref:hypothetical protein n=1 Tax=Corynebacterium sp. PCR 32 TaxID=3351342 RepID=UPI0030A05B03